MEQLGHGNTTDYSSPKQVGSLTTWAKASISSKRCTTIKTDGTLWVWGDNAKGALGDGTTIAKSSPIQIGALTTWAKVSSLGSVHTAAVKTDGTLWTWGQGAFGKLGLGNETDYSSPKQVGSLTNWAQPFTIGSSTFAIKTDGTLWGWGYNGTKGVLGLGNSTHYSSPKQVGALTTWLSIVSESAGAAGRKTSS